MPRCDGVPVAGSPAVECPDRVNDSSVCLRQGDLMLCNKCNDTRFGSHKKVDCVADASVDLPVVVTNELLCFVQQKSKQLAFDDTVAICVDFYMLDEIKSAVSIVSKYCKQRIPVHQGSNKARKYVSDMLKVVLDPTVKLPTFAAVDLSRLPPVGVEHMDVSAFLKEVSLLRSEVRSIATLRAEIVELRQLLNSKRADGHVAEVDKIVPAASESSAVCQDSAHGSESVSISRSIAERLTDAIQSGAISKTSQPRTKPKRKLIVGKSANSKLQSVTTRRKVEIFVSRVAPTMNEDDLKDFVHEAISSCPGSSGCAAADVTCEKLVSKHDSYASYHITTAVDSVMFKDAVDTLMSNEVWPMGMLVRRFFIKRNDSAQ